MRPPVTAGIRSLSEGWTAVMAVLPPLARGGINEQLMQCGAVLYHNFTL